MNDKMDELLALYDNTLMSMGVPRVEQKYEASTGERRLQHLRWMIDDLQQSKNKTESDRLILFGLIQGGLWAETIFAPLVLQEHRQNLLDVVPSAK
jgi:hypothetical protein